MKKIILLFISLVLFMNISNAQETQVEINENLKFEVNNFSKKEFLTSLEQLFVDIDSDISKSNLVSKAGYSENIFLLNEIKKIRGEKGKTYGRELLNFYPIESNQFLFKIAFIEKSNIRAIVTLIAVKNEDGIAYSSPINYRTKHWKTKQIGNVKYFYKNSLNKTIAKAFNKKNTEIAKKFGMKIKDLTYYKCSDYEEVQQLLGLDYDSKSVGTVQSSEAFENTIITGVNSENFDHDVFHMYIETKFPDNSDRNFIAEEGYANSIADAYYAKKSGEIITREELVGYLKEYLEKNPDADLLELFQKNPRVYFQLSNQVSKEVFNLLSVRSTITSLICDDVEKQKGLDGLVKLLRSGKGEDAFFKFINNQVGINKSNFNVKVLKLVSAYK